MSPNTPIFVKKRNGETETLQIEKLHKMVLHACEGISGVYPSQVEMNSRIQFFDGMTTEEIQQVLIKSAANLISEEYPNYQYVAARLMLFGLRKQVWKSAEPLHLAEIVAQNIAHGVYDSELPTYFTTEEWDKLNSFIKHDRDLNFTYAGMKQVYDKYLVQNRITKQRYETPQYAYLLIAAILYKDYPEATKMKYIKKYYDAISLHKISLPTPIIAGVRTPTRQFASCVLMETDDTLDSIFTSATAIGQYVARRAGIGLHVGNIRAIKSSIRNGDVEHTGLIPFLKLFQASIGSCSQGGLRQGSATVTFPIWHYEIEDLVVLKNNQGTEDNRVRYLDYSVSISKLFYERYINNESITLFSPHEVPELVKSFGQPEFDELYQKAEKKRSIRKRVVSARDLLNNLISERVETGRIYILNIDHFNQHSSFDIPLHTSNLCQEISLPTKPLSSVDDAEGEISTCILSAINLGSFKQLEDLEEICDLAVRSLDALIDFQSYPLVAAELSTKARRSIGIGYINLAYLLAKNKLKWDDVEARRLVHRVTEAVQFYCLKASNQLAIERGACEKFGETKYAKGILPIDTYKKDVDVFAPFALEQDWETLRANIIHHGLRNSTLTAIMPSESSSVVSGATNGIEPPRAYLSVKKSKSGTIKLLVPEYARLKNFYELLWDMKTTTPYLQIAAIIQKFVDQSMSTNTSYNPIHYEKNEIPLSVVVKDILYAYKIGLKSLYYNNTYDMNEDVDTDKGVSCDSGACAI